MRTAKEAFEGVFRLHELDEWGQGIMRDSFSAFEAGYKAALEEVANWLEEKNKC